MSIAIIAALTIGGAIAYGLGRIHGAEDTQDQLLKTLDHHGTIFVKVKGEDRVVTGYVETYGDWFKCKRPVPLQTATVDKVTVRATGYQSNPGNAQHAAKVIVKGTEGYEHPFLNTGSRG